MTKQDKITALEFTIEVLQTKLSKLKNEVHTDGDETACPVGQVWNPILKQCQDDI